MTERPAALGTACSLGMMGRGRRGTSQVTAIIDVFSKDLRRRKKGIPDTVKIVMEPS
jgi:hypothetical protein